MKIKIGFSPLTDCAPLIVAKEQGFFESQGLDVELCKEVSWANIRDKLVFGEYQAAHMLAPMLMAATLGAAGSLKKALVSAYSFGLNGNAVSVSNALYESMLKYDSELILHPESTADVLKKVVEGRARLKQEKLRFAVVFPFSMHYYLLNHWLQAAGLKVNEDVEILVVPPVRVVQALEEGLIDGYCVGEPWNTHAVKKQVGVTVITGYEIWNNAPEKVLGVTQEWAIENEETHKKLVWALYQASEWIDDDLNRTDLIGYLSMPEYVNAPISSIENAIDGQVCNPVCKSCRSIPNFSLPFKFFANFPWQSHAKWILRQMIALGQISEDTQLDEVASRVYLTSLYREVMQEHGVLVPEFDDKPEGEHAEPWSKGGVVLSEDRFL
ncbi:MAG: CmpA/NrtA family ABC transporter substrate-binding protein [Pseudomonadota bacterium]|nr:CmpA/NrtA family ABC transporter substrate-binding protein [Pseudomonadota bacterium]